MDAIQRSQKMLEARLQDIQTTLKHDESTRSDDARHSRFVLSEMQKALEAVVRSMSSTQDGVQSMATVLMAVCQAINANSTSQCTYGVYPVNNRFICVHFALLHKFHCAIANVLTSQQSYNYIIR
jgi:hypothetical protein